MRVLNIEQPLYPFRVWGLEFGGLKWGLGSRIADDDHEAGREAAHDAAHPLCRFGFGVWVLVLGVCVLGVETGAWG